VNKLRPGHPSLAVADADHALGLLSSHNKVLYLVSGSSEGEELIDVLAFYRLGFLSIFGNDEVMEFFEDLGVALASHSSEDVRHSSLSFKQPP